MKPRNLLVSPADDAFFYAQLFLHKVVEPIGAKILHEKIKKVHKENQLEQTVVMLKRKLHDTHSPLKKIARFENSYNTKPYILTPIQKIRKRLRHGI